MLEGVMTPSLPTVTGPCPHLPQVSDGSFVHWFFCVFQKKMYFCNLKHNVDCCEIINLLTHL